MDHQLLIDLHRELRGAVGYRGSVPRRSKLDEALCRLRRVEQDTDHSRLYVVEQSILGTVLFVIAPVILISLARARLSPHPSLVDGGGAGVALDGVKVTWWELATGALLLAFGISVLFAMFRGGMERKGRMRRRLFSLYGELLGDRKELLPSRSQCSEAAGEAAGEAEEDGAGGGGSGAGGGGSGAGGGGSGAGDEAGGADDEAGEATRLVREALVATDTARVTQGISRAVRSLRSLVGAASLREADETDISALISEVLVPEMLEARRRMEAGSPEHGEAAESCSKECGETAEGVAAAFEAGEDVSAEALERAWADCPDSMREACGRLKRSKDRCAAMCNTRGHQVRRFHTVLGHVPGGDWEAHAQAKTEAQCWAACGEDFDAAAFVREEGSKGAARCYLHSADSTYEEFREAPEARGVVLVKDGSPMLIPGNDPSQAAEAIAESVKARSMALDLSGRRGEIMRELREQAPTSYEKDLPWFEDCVSAVVGLLAHSERSEGRVPNAGHYNRALRGMTAQQLQDRVTWPVVSASVFLEVRAGSTLLASGGDGLPGVPGKWPTYHAVFWTGLLCLGAGVGSWLHGQARAEPAEGDFLSGPWSKKTAPDAFSGAAKAPRGGVGARLAAAAERAGRLVDSAASSGRMAGANPLAPGRLRSRKAWAVVHSNLATLALLGMVVTLCVTRFLYWVKAQRTNEDRRRENTELLISRTRALRAHLLGLTGSLPELAAQVEQGSPEGEKAEAEAQAVRAAAFAGDPSVLRPFPRERRSTPAFDALTTPQRNKLLELCMGVLEAYDLCNNAALDERVPFPLSEVVVYGGLAAGGAAVVWHLQSQVGMGELMDGSKRLKRALQAAEAGAPGAMAVLRAEMMRGSVYHQPFEVMKDVGKYVFVSLTAAVIVMLARESATSRERLGLGSECAA